MLSEPHKLSNLIWQKNKFCDKKSWTYFFYSVHDLSINAFTRCLKKKMLV